MDYNKISGSTIDATTSLMFKEFENEHFYLAFMRQNESWGNCALINISLDNDAPISDIIASVHGENDKFTDKNIPSYQDVDLRVYIYKTNSTIPDFDSTLSNYTKIDELENSEIRLHYINNNWAVIKGLPPSYNDYINLTSNEKFYIIRNNVAVYSENPDNTNAICKISVKSLFDYSANNEPAILKAVDDNVEITALTNINLCYNILGEISIDGYNDTNLNTPYITESILLSDYAIMTNEIITGSTPYFILRKASNQTVKVFEKMYLMKTLTDEGDETIWHYGNDNTRYLLFKSSNMFNQNTYIKISSGVSSQELAIYHESLPYTFNTIDSANNVSDANPPSLDSTYLKNQELNESLFDIQCLVKIKKSQLVNDAPSDLYSKVSFVRELKNETEKNKYLGYGFVYNSLAEKRIESVEITSTTPIRHYGNIKRNPRSIDGNYGAYVSRLYLYTNNFVIGDKLTIRYWNPDHTSYNELQNQTTNANGDRLEVVGISYDEDNCYIDINGTTNRAIVFGNDWIDGEVDTIDDATILSDSTNTIVKVEYAVTDSYIKAIKYNMNKVMVEMKLPTLPELIYSGIYRQIAIVHQPKYFNGVMVNCGDDDIYNESFYDFNNHKYDIGTVIFLANKTPIYRQYLNDKEVFKLIV